MTRPEIIKFQSKIDNNPTSHTSAPIPLHPSGPKGEGGLWGCTSQQVKIPFLSGEILDVGTGSGVIAKRIIDNGDNLTTALEPGNERSNDDNFAPSFECARSRLSGVDVRNETLQQFIKAQPEKQFDSVTCFKYNVPVDQKEEFIQALAQVVKPDGTVYIHCVEKFKCFRNPEFPRAYLVTELQKYFEVVNVEQRSYGRGLADGMIVCKKPKIRPEII